MPEHGPSGLQQRFETSDTGRGLLSAFIAVILATVLVMQIPGSYLRGQLMTLAGPFGNSTGLDQNWSVFAPDPRRRVLDLEARLTYADGTVREWHVPRADDVVGVYYDYRWLKYMETVHQDQFRHLWRHLASWVARDAPDADRLVRVDLVRRWYELYAPGTGLALRSPWREYQFFSLPVRQVRAERG